MPEEIKEIASSLKIYRKEDLSRGLLAVEIIKEFDKWYQLLEKKDREKQSLTDGCNSVALLEDRLR